MAFLFYFLLKPKIKDKKILVWFCVFLVISIGVFCELYEFGLDYFFGTLTQGLYSFPDTPGFCGGDAVTAELRAQAVVVLDKITDTMLDMAMNTFGTLVFVLVTHEFLKRKKWS